MNLQHLLSSYVCVFFFQLIFGSQVIRSGQKLLRKKSTDGGKKGGGWFSGLWGKKEAKKQEDEEELSVPESRCSSKNTFLPCIAQLLECFCQTELELWMGKALVHLLPVP